MRNRPLDLLRGLVMVLMAIDHARTFGGSPVNWAADPMPLPETPPLFFVLRWITHFCAPVFALLMGISAFLAGERKSMSDRTRDLAIRGGVLIVLEFTVVNFAWAFTPFWPRYFFQVIAALGCGSLALALLSRFAPPVALSLGLVLTFGHNLFDGVRFEPDTPMHYVWSILHQKNVLPLWPGKEFRTTYPVVPIVALAAIGYGIGHWFRAPLTTAIRRRLTIAGAAVLALFLLLRLPNLYGDTSRFTPQADWLYTLFSLGNVTKYPLSLHFVLMTIGPALLFLAGAKDTPPRFTEWIETLGRTPLFFYVAHLAVIHAVALAMAAAAGYYPFDFTHHFGGLHPDFRYPMWWCVPFALLASWAMVPACRWYEGVRRSRRVGLLAYL